MTLLGAGKVIPDDLKWSLLHAPRLIAADGGANFALNAGIVPDAVIGDFDSVSAAALAPVPETRRLHVAEQDSTDFEKCLSRIEAPMILGVGLLDGRMDHALATLSVLTRYPGKRCLLLGEEDVAFLAPATLRLSLEVGQRLSLFPMAPVTGRSEGLQWPIDGIGFAPDGAIGTSNRVCARQVRLEFDAPKMIVMLPRAAAEAALTGLGS